MAGLLVVFLAVVPLAALAAAGQVAASGMRAERAQARWRQVPAGPAAGRAGARPRAVPGVPGAPGAGAVDGAWRGAARGRGLRVGGARAGTTVMVWTDGSGRLEGAPVQRADVTVLEAFAALAAAALAATVVVVTGFLARRSLDRRRLAAWDAEWSRTGPQWTGRV